ncbi:MAG TPA: hypothetical protein DC038_06135 [Clostridiales bacterium]|nr:hypothetical protein [Clostridiales bacterium]
MLSRIHNLLKYCYNDNSGDRLPDINLQLFLIAAKSMMPYEDAIGCSLDTIRYEKEIELLAYYKNGCNDSLNYYLENKKPWEKEDALLEFRIIPVIIANTQWDNLLNEVLKTVSFYSSNKKDILNSLIISSAVNEYLSEDIFPENINDIIKERVINFSLRDFYDANNIQINKVRLIEFEKERISALSKIAIVTDEMIEKFKSLKFIFCERTTEKSDESTETVLSSFSSYLFKLRKGIISPEKLRISLDNIPEFKEFLKYESFSHPLLGKCRVLKRGEKEVILKSKTGLMKVNL